MPNYLTSLSAFDALNVSLQASANNIANVNTDGYKAQYAVLRSGPQDHGVEVARVYRDMAPGPAVIASIGEWAARKVYGGGMEYALGNESVYAPQHTLPAINSGGDQNVHNPQEQEARAYDVAVSNYGRYFVEGSNSDIARDFVNLNMVETAYEANAAVVRAEEDMTGVLFNIVS